MEEPPRCILAMRAVPKKNGKHRLVIDCCPINEPMQKLPFSQEGIKIVAELKEENDILMTVDVKDGFHHIPLHRDSQTYVGISWKGRYYVWCVLCFGIAIAPYLFHKTLRPVISFLRQKGVRVAPFVDDLLLMIRACLASQHRDLVLQTLRKLGWCPNLDKCDLTVTTQTVFVGFDINSNTTKGPWLRVLPAKIRKLRRAIVKTLNALMISARGLAKVAGQCIAMTKAIVPGKLLLCNIYRVIASQKDWEDKELVLSPGVIKDLQWWLDALKGWNRAPL